MDFRVKTYIVSPTLFKSIGIFLLWGIFCGISPAHGQEVNQGYQGKIDAVIKAAKSYLGTDYKWGGNDYTGIDCSGLTCNSFKAAGIDIPRNSQKQAYDARGQFVAMKDLQPGDLVFFSDRRRGGIGHVGIITAAHEGIITFIHAAGGKGVVFDFLHDWADRYVMARRFFHPEVTPPSEEEIQLASIDQLRSKIFSAPHTAAAFQPDTTLGPGLTRGGGTSGNIDPVVPGQYPQGSADYLHAQDLTALSPCEIRIMKNEIFARHGYKFKENPGMVRHFQDQAWYRSIPEAFGSSGYLFYTSLSAIERHNVAFLKQYEGNCD